MDLLLEYIRIIAIQLPFTASNFQRQLKQYLYYNCFVVSIVYINSIFYIKPEYI